MSVVPAEIAGIGSTAMKLRVSPGFDPLKAQVGPDEYFLLSRIDGSQTLREVILATGLPVERAISIVTRLRSIGALLLPGETQAPAPAAAPKEPTPTRTAVHTPSAPLTPPQGVPAITTAPASSGPVVSRTATPHTPMPASKQPARPTPPAGIPVTQTPLAVARTTTPALSLGNRAPAKRPSVPDLDPPTQKRPSSRDDIERSGSAGPRSAAEGRRGDEIERSGSAGPRSAAEEIDPPTIPRSPPLDPPTVRRAPSADINVVLPNANDEERKALAETNDIGPDERLKILALARLVPAGDPYALLGVPSGADAKVLKRAYFLLSKDIHPDRYFGRQLGTFGERLSLVFEAVSRAYARLTQPDKHKSNRAQHMVAEQPQTPQEYAAELFDRACGLEVGGDHLGAMKLFAAAVRIDPQTRYLRRAASCALAAEQPKTALEYAKKAQTQAPNDLSAARLLAYAFKATGKYADAEEVLIMAMAIKSENDVLTAELRHDLAEVRRLLSG